MPYLLSIRQAAREFGISRERIATWIKQGKVPAMRDGKRVVVRSADLKHFIDAMFK